MAMKKSLKKNHSRLNKSIKRIRSRLSSSVRTFKRHNEEWQHDSAEYAELQNKIGYIDLFKYALWRERLALLFGFLFMWYAASWQPISVFILAIMATLMGHFHKQTQLLDQLDGESDQQQLQQQQQQQQQSNGHNNATTTTATTLIATASVNSTDDYDADGPDYDDDDQSITATDYNKDYTTLTDDLLTTVKSLLLPQHHHQQQQQLQHQHYSSYFHVPSSLPMDHHHHHHRHHHHDRYDDLNHQHQVSRGIFAVAQQQPIEQQLLVNHTTGVMQEFELTNTNNNYNATTTSTDGGADADSLEIYNTFPLLAPVAAFITPLSDLSKPTQDIKDAVEDVVSHESELFLRRSFEINGAAFLLALTQLTAFCIGLKLITWSAKKQASRIKLLYFRSCLHQEVTWFESIDSASGSGSSLNALVDKFEDGIGTKLALLSYFLGHVALFALTAFYQMFSLSLFCMSFVLAIGLMIMFVSEIQATAMGQHALFAKRSLQLAEEILSAIRTVFAFNGQHKELQRFDTSLGPAYNKSLMKHLFTALDTALSKFSIFACFGAYCFYAMHLFPPYSDIALNKSTVLAVMRGAEVSIVNILISIPFMEALQQAKGSIARIYAAIERKSKIDPSCQLGQKPNNQDFLPSIRFHQVSFEYLERSPMRRRSTLPFINLPQTIIPMSEIMANGTTACSNDGQHHPTMVGASTMATHTNQTVAPPATQTAFNNPNAAPPPPLTGRKRLSAMKRGSKFNAASAANNGQQNQSTLILDGFSLNIEPGKSVALVGSSGSGKSTILSLVQRLYDIRSGAIFIGQNNICDLNVGWLRTQIGVVNQEPRLFDMTIEENIRLGVVLPKSTTLAQAASAVPATANINCGNASISMAQVIEAARCANAHDFIERLPQGYQTKVGTGGVQLSGGQKQRIAIARALIRKPKILLLDESTSALDSESETIVQKALEQASKGRTTLIVAHRLSTVKNVDKIVVMDHGKVLEVGTHQELMNKDQGVYRHMYEQQLNEQSSNSNKTTAGAYRYQQAMKKSAPTHRLHQVAQQQGNQFNKTAQQHCERPQDSKVEHMSTKEEKEQQHHYRESGAVINSGIITAVAETENKQPTGANDKGLKLDVEQNCCCCCCCSSNGKCLEIASKKKKKKSNNHDDDQQQQQQQCGEKQQAIGNCCCSCSCGSSLEDKNDHTTSNKCAQDDCFDEQLDEELDESSIEDDEYDDDDNNGDDDDDDDDHHHEDEEDEDENGQRLNKHQLSLWALLRFIQVPKISGICALIACFLAGLILPMNLIAHSYLFSAFAYSELDQIGEHLYLFGVAILSMSTFVLIISFLQVTLPGYVGEKISTRLRLTTMKSLLEKPIFYYDMDSNSAGTLCSKFNTYITDIQSIAGTRVATILEAVSTLTAGAIFGFGQNLKLSLFCLSFAVIVLITTIIESRIFQREVALQQKYDAKLAHLMADALSNIKTIASLHQEHYFACKFKQIIMERERGVGSCTAWLRTFLTSLKFVMPAMSWSASMYYGCHLLVNKQIDLQTIFIVCPVVLFAVNDTFRALVFLPELLKARKSIEKLYRLNREYSPELMQSLTLEQQQQVIGSSANNGAGDSELNGGGGVGVGGGWDKAIKGNQLIGMTKLHASKQHEMTTSQIRDLTSSSTTTTTPATAVGIAKTNRSITFHPDFDHHHQHQHRHDGSTGLQMINNNNNTKRNSSLIGNFVNTATHQGRRKSRLNSLVPRLESRGRIDFKDVTFSYPMRPGALVLDGLTLSVAPGESVAIVGASGSGKSTCVGLLEKFYDYHCGKLTIDGYDLRFVAPNWVRSQIGLVSQEPTLLSYTIGDNIRYGDNSRYVSKEEIIRAAKTANIHDFIMTLPDEYDTELSNSTYSSQLSGGQKQRIAIARALVRNAPILIFDEATSALDSNNETAVQDALDKARFGKTQLIIAHRLATVKNVDRIIVMRSGKVVEQGTHQQLMSSSSVGHYRRLYERQAQSS